MEEQEQELSGEDEALLRLASTLLDSGYRFTTTTPATHRRVNARPANRWAKDAAGIFGWSRPFRAELLPAPLFALAREAGALVEQAGGEDAGAWRSRYRLSTLDSLAFLHSSYPTEGADSVFFGPDSVRFAAALSRHMEHAAAPTRAIDIGCGAGIGALLIARAHPDAETVMADINLAALRLARLNAKLAGLPRTRTAQSDLLASVDGNFDLIVSNPPYLPDRLRRTYRDGGGELGAGLAAAITALAATRLLPGGTLLLYTGAAIVDGANLFLAAIKPILAQAGLAWRCTELDPDVFGEELEDGPLAASDRIAALWLVITKPL